MNTIEIYPSKNHEAKAYEVFCAKRFKALLVERKPDGTYEGDREAMPLFCQELRRAGVVFMPLVIDGRKIDLI